MGMISITLSSSVTPVSGARLLFGTAVNIWTHVILNGQVLRTNYFRHHTRMFSCFSNVTHLVIHNSGFGSEYEMFDVLWNEVLSLHLFPVWRTVHEPHQIRLVKKGNIFFLC